MHNLTPTGYITMDERAIQRLILIGNLIAFQASKNETGIKLTTAWNNQCQRVISGITANADKRRATGAHR